MARRVGQARKRDANEAEIVDALRAVGAVVLPISGAGVPDLLTFFRGRWLPLEVKRERPRRSLSDRRGRTLTPAQCEVWGKTRFPVVWSVNEALKAIGALKSDVPA